MFHAGDGNLHPLVCYDAAREGEPERAEELAGLIIKACVDADGSITGEHGVGVDKKAYMPSMFSEADLDAFHRLRCAFDPPGLANPGKLMPTPRLCGEVPGPYREHPLERAGVADAVLGAWRELSPTTFEEAAAALASAAADGRGRADPRRRHEARMGQRHGAGSGAALHDAGLTGSSSTTSAI